MNCLHCDKEFQPKQKYCSTNCRVYSHQKRKGPIQTVIIGNGTAKPLKLNSTGPISETPKIKAIKKFKERIPLSKKMEENILHPEPKTFIRKRGELDPSDYL